MAFLKRSVAINKPQPIEKIEGLGVPAESAKLAKAHWQAQENALRGLNDAQVKELLLKFKGGNDIGFIPSPELLAKYGLN
jgi:hypothetical protein